MRSPTSKFISVDLPTLGLPTMFTKPALCIYYICFAPYADTSSAAPRLPKEREKLHGRRLKNKKNAPNHYGWCVLNFLQSRSFKNRYIRPLWLDCSLLLDSELASVITTRTANGVINMPLAAVGADSKCRSYCLVICSSLGSSCL